MRKLFVAGGVAVAGVAAMAISTAALTTPRAATVKFADARLKIEFNATDGDAGLQVFADAPAWREITVTNPAGRQVMHVAAEDVIEDYGLTELFSESSEPPFDVFPFEQFKQLFPDGRYTFTGESVNGERLRSTFTLSHDVPDGPVITSPAEDATLAADELVVEWQPDATPGVNVVAYQVLVVAEDPFVGNPVRVLDVMLPADAARLPVPAEFLLPGDYKTEVLAIEESGNQTLTEVAFSIE
jgi:hypothetical protein